MNSPETTKNINSSLPEAEPPTYRGTAYQGQLPEQSSKQPPEPLTNIVSPVSVDERQDYKAPRSDHVSDKSKFAIGGDVDSSVDRIYLTLDCILDTKLGCIAQHAPEIATKLLKEGKWSKRLTDNWPGILGNKLFREWYDARDLETLKHSVLTNMNFFMKRLIKDNIVHTVHTQTNDRVVFELNIWPYVSPDNEFIEMLVECIRFHSYSAASIVIVSIEPKDLSPLYVRERYKVVVMNDLNGFLSWIKEHGKFFEKQGIPEIVFVTPMALDDNVNFTEMKKYKITPQHAMDEVTKMMQSLVNLRPHPVSLFCITEAITKDTAKTIVETVAVTQNDIEQHILKIDPEAVFEEVPINKEIPLDLTSDDEENVKGTTPEEDDPFTY